MSQKEYPTIRTLTQKHLKNLRKVQVEDNCSKIDSDTKIKCNICGYETDLEFLHYGKNRRNNEKCPNCYSLKRTRRLWYYIEKHTNILKNKEARILHTSPESSIYKKLKELYGQQYTTSDITQSPYIDEIIDIQDIPYEDNTFDLIISSHVLEHVPDDYRAIREFHRILKPGAMIILLVPSLPFLKKTFELPQINTPNLRQRYYRQKNHRRYYSNEDFFRLLELAGFKTLKDDEYFVSDEKIRQRYSLDDDATFVAIKKSQNKEKSTISQEKTCSICNSTGMQQNRKHDLICIHCNSTSIERLYYNNVKDLMSNDTKVLYINPKEVLEDKLKTITCNYRAISESDKGGFIDKTLNKLTNSHDHSITRQLEKIRDNSFDVVLTYHLLDKTENDTDLIGQLSRIIKKDGKLLLKENMDWELLHKMEDESINTHKLRRMFYGNPFAIRCYGYDFIEFLESNGFIVEYEHPDSQRDNLLLFDEVVKDPLLVCTRR